MATDGNENESGRYLGSAYILGNGICPFSRPQAGEDITRLLAMVSIALDRSLRNLNKKYSITALALTSAIVCFTSGIIFGLVLRGDLTYTSEIWKEPPLTYMLHGDHINSGYLQHVENVLQRLGFNRVDNSTHFDLLWSHVYPFGERAPFPKSFLQNLKPFQKVNHFPGSGFFTNKVDLAVTGLKHIPKAFHLPGQKQEILEYAARNPNLMFVQKSNAHRGIKIHKVKDMNLDQAETFVQEYVQNPLLIDGYKFDIGIYTIVTSIDPLRVYIYNGEALLRFCPHKYYPFDPNDVDKYVVGDDYIPTWEIPSLKKVYNDLQFNMKESLNFYLRNKGKDPSKIWTQIEETIAKVLEAKETKILGITQRYKNNGNFFEMVRFDFIVDENLNTYLMEANMSPNLSSEHFPPNRVLYENVLFNVFGLVGIGRRIHADTLSARTGDEAIMEVPERRLMVFAEPCAGLQCATCASTVCSLCQHCLTQQSLAEIREAYLEHLNRLDCKRIFPPKMNPLMRVDDLDLENLSPENRAMSLWFLGQCQLDETWC